MFVTLKKRGAYLDVRIRNPVITFAVSLYLVVLPIVQSLEEIR